MIYVTLNFWDGSKVCCFKTRKSKVSTQVLPQVSTQVKPALGHIYVTGILSADYYYQGRNHEENLGATTPMVGRICPPWLE